MRVSALPTFIAFLMLGPGAPAHAIQEMTPEPGQRYEVTDVTAGDALNVRSQPGTAAAITGRLSSDATGVYVAGTRAEVDGSVWWQIIGPQASGWVNARYLTPMDAHAEHESSFPLRCLGTEPFWSLTVDGEKAKLETPDTAAVWTAGEMVSAQGMRGRYAIRLENDGGVGHLTAWRNYGFCSDGMSDVGYPFEGIVAAPDGSVLAGCCMRTSGDHGFSSNQP